MGRSNVRQITMTITKQYDCVRTCCNYILAVLYPCSLLSCRNNKIRFHSGGKWISGGRKDTQGMPLACSAILTAGLETAPKSRRSISSQHNIPGGSSVSSERPRSPAPTALARLFGPGSMASRGRLSAVEADILPSRR